MRCLGVAAVLLYGGHTACNEHLLAQAFCLESDVPPACCDLPADAAAQPARDFYAPFSRQDIYKIRRVHLASILYDLEDSTIRCIADD